MDNHEFNMNAIQRQMSHQSHQNMNTEHVSFDLSPKEVETASHKSEKKHIFTMLQLKILVSLFLFIDVFTWITAYIVH